MIDAFWAARAPLRVDDAPSTRSAPRSGLLAILAVLLGTHATVAKPLYGLYDTLVTITGGGDAGPLKLFQNQWHYRHAHSNDRLIWPKNAICARVRQETRFLLPLS